MLVLDTDHLTELGYSRPRGRRLVERIEASGTPAVTTIITVEEQLRGWLARIAAIADVDAQVGAYAELGERVNFLASFTFLPWDRDAALLFKQFRKQGVRIGTMDLKIACIALGRDALLLTGNTKDFAKVPSLQYESWLD
jgi:tRNA(fMet)-specific endonuclease VapC